jgi:hypothetical protein
MVGFRATPRDLVNVFVKPFIAIVWSKKAFQQSVYILFSIFPAEYPAILAGHIYLAKSCLLFVVWPIRRWRKAGSLSDLYEKI